MKSEIKEMLLKEQLSENDIVELLRSDGDEKNALYMKSVEVRAHYLSHNARLNQNTFYRRCYE